MGRHKTILAIVSVSLYLLDSLPAQAATYAPAGGVIKDFKLHRVDTKTLDPAGNPGKANIGPKAIDTWTVTLTNGSTTPWTDFHVEILPIDFDAVAAEFVAGKVTITGSGPGAPPGGFDGFFPVFNPLILKITSRPGSILGPWAKADLAPKVENGKLPPGSSITLTVQVTDTFPILGADYYLGVQPTSGAFPGPATQKNKGKSGGSSIIFDASLQSLSFTGHRMVDTGFPHDPILSADVNIPSFQFESVLSGGEYLFQSGSPGSLLRIIDSTGTFLQSAIPYLVYLPNSNSFYGEATSFSLPGVQSPWIAQMANLFNPLSPGFDPSVHLYFTYQPTDNLFNLTQGFTRNGNSDGGDGISAAQETPLYEYDFYASGTKVIAAAFRFPGFVRHLPVIGFRGFIQPTPDSLNPCDLTSNSPGELNCGLPGSSGGIFEVIFRDGDLPTELGPFVADGFLSPNAATPSMGEVILESGQIIEVSSAH
jgi:hypothetical protein